MEIAVNSAIQYFEGHSQKNVCSKFEDFWSLHHNIAAL